MEICISSSVRSPKSGRTVAELEDAHRLSNLVGRLVASPPFRRVTFYSNDPLNLTDTDKWGKGRCSRSLYYYPVVLPRVPFRPPIVHFAHLRFSISPSTCLLDSVECSFLFRYITLHLSRILSQHGQRNFGIPQIPLSRRNLQE